MSIAQTLIKLETSSLSMYDTLNILTILSLVIFIKRILIKKKLCMQQLNIISTSYRTIPSAI